MTPDSVTKFTTTTPSKILNEWLTTPATKRELDLQYLPKKIFNYPKPVSNFLCKILGIQSLLPIHDKIPAALSAQQFAEKGLNALGIQVKTNKDFATKIPKTGSLVIVCNHPFGGLDGFALMAKLLSIRPDTKFVVNLALGVFPDLRACSLPLDVFSNSQESRGLNMATLRLANTHIQKNGAIVFFPSGTVSYWQKDKGIVDPVWQDTASRIAINNDSPVIPIFFHGHNSLIFNLAGMIHPTLRTIMLPREMGLKINKTIKITAGNVIEPLTLKVFDKPKVITTYLRMRCYTLKQRDQLNTHPSNQKKMIPVATSHSSERIEKNLKKLPSSSLLLQEGYYSLYVIRSEQSSLLLEEIGVLRERAFRLIGEGSGKARDIDHYDDSYYQLLLWHEKDKRLVGAYRFGKTQEILAKYGKKGLYTTSLFKISKDFFHKYPHSLELGRAVIDPDYQREYAPLFMLWKGIGRFVVQAKDVHCLFGPVSLSLNYSPVSLRIIVEYLQKQCEKSDLPKMVQGRYLPSSFFNNGTDFTLPEQIDYNGLAILVKDIENGKSIPILFKHYLKLGGKIAAFHMDKDFNSLDAFLLIDLLKSPRNMVERYLSSEGTATFLSNWTNRYTNKNE